VSFEQLSVFLRRHFGPPRLALVVAAWVLALGVWGTLARDVFPMEHRLEWEIPVELRAPLYAKFDSGWYLSIIDWGYGPPPPQGNPSSHAFFPLYPWTAKVLHRTFALDGFHAGMLVAYLALFLAMPLFFREALERFGGAEARAWRSVAFLLLFPTAFFLASMYAESTFFLFSILALRDARAAGAARTRAAALWGVLLGLTKASAMCVAPAIFFAAFLGGAGAASEPRVSRLRRALLLAAVPFATVWTWVFGIGIVKGEPGLYFRSLAGWHRGSSPLSGVAFWFRRAGEFFGRAEWKDDPMRLLDYGAAVLFLVLLIRFLVRRRWAEASWTAAALALPVSTGLTYGIPRYVLSVYPAFYELEWIFERHPRGRVIWWAASGALLLFAAARFVNALGVA
jgi:hypothetical protein